MAIDFVLAWVDGSDPEWQRSRDSFRDVPSAPDDAERYRDWGLLKYWFRTVAKNAPWVNMVYLVTAGHVPTWLNIDHPKLRVVRHDEFIPSEYLPTFSSHTIELNLHRIPGLSEQFVYFNDDMFLNRPCKPRDFFVRGKPRDVAALNVHCYSLSQPIQLIATRNVGVINEHFDFRDSIRSNFSKWITPLAGRKIVRTLALLGCPRFPGFYQTHCAQPFLKRTFDAVWDAEPELLDETCSHRFRVMTDVNPWVVREWQIASGGFVSRPDWESKVFFLTHTEDQVRMVQQAAKDVKSRRHKLICVNDGPMDSSTFEACATILRDAFSSVYPERAEWETDSSLDI